MNFIRNNIIVRLFRRATNGVRSVARTFTNLATGRQNQTGNQPTYTKQKGLKDANRNNVDKSKVKDTSTGYISGVDSFAPEEKQESIRPVYQYSHTPTEDDLDEEEEYSDEFKDEFTDEEEPDLWDEDNISQEDKDFYNERMQELREQESDSRNEILTYYKLLAQDADDLITRARKEVRDFVYKNIPLNDITQVPYFLANTATVEEGLKRKVNVRLSEETTNTLIEEEVKRYRDTVLDFMDITEKGGKYFINDWKYGIQVIDFLKKEGQFPEMLLLLTNLPVSQVVQVMRTGYLPEPLKRTPYDKVAFIFEGVAHQIENGTGEIDYSFPKAYHTYKQELKMYKRLRNNGRLADVNTVLGFFYKTIDNVEVSDDVKGDAFLGLIEPHEFINAYIQFFYGRAKQSQAMSDFTLSLMKKNPAVLQRVGSKGYAIADEPKGTLFILSGRVVILTNVTGDNYTVLLNKAPSDLKAEDTNNIAGMFKQEDTTKPNKKEPEQEKKPANEFGSSYNYDEAIQAFGKQKRKKSASRKKKQTKK